MHKNISRLQRALAKHSRSAAACVGVLAIASCSAPPGSEFDDDGPGEFGGTLPQGAAPAPAAPGVPATQTPAAPPPSGAPAASATPAPAPTPSNEQPASNGTPIAATTPPATDNSGANNGAGGSSMVPPDGDLGAGGSSMAVGAGGAPPVEPAPVAQQPPPPPVTPPVEQQPPAVTPPPIAAGGLSPAEIDSFFASQPCGVRYSALGDGSYSACVRVANGAACTKSSAEFTPVTFADGTPVTGVAVVNSMGENAVGIVTTAGALHVGESVTSIGATPLIASGVVNFSGGRNARAALVDEGGGFGIVGWNGNGAPAPLVLPNGEEPIQVSANYGLACALSRSGSVFCWDQGGNVSIQGLSGQAAPVPVDLGAPVRQISAGQDTLCGVTFANTLACTGNFNASPYLPTERVDGNVQFLATTFPSVREVHAAFQQGTVVTSDGAAYFLPGVPAGEDNPGIAFTGAADVIAAGGDRGTACVLTSAGEVYCMFGSGGGATQRATLGGQPLVAQQPQCAL